MYFGIVGLTVFVGVVAFLNLTHERTKPNKQLTYRSGKTRWDS